MEIQATHKYNGEMGIWVFNMQAKIFTDFSLFDRQPGSYYWDKANNELWFILPCGHDFVPHGHWQQSNVDDPNSITLYPSIFCHGIDSNPCWHGWLTNGQFINA